MYVFSVLQYLQGVTGDHQSTLGCLRVESKLNAENILYICEGHHASVIIDEGSLHVGTTPSSSLMKAYSM